MSKHVELQGLTLTALNGIYLRLDTTNDPLTGTLDGANLDFTGHAAIGADASVGVYTLLDLDETLVFRDTTGYGIFADLYLEPPGVLSASTHLVAMDMQAQWNGAVDGSVHASVQGIKGEGINRAAVQPINEIVGVYGKANNLGISDVTEAIAGLFNVANDDAIGTELGDITNAYSILARAYTDKDTGVITNRYGLYIEDITGGGTTTNQYGIYCPALVGGGTNLFINNVSAASNFGSGNIVTTGTLGAGESTLDRLGVHTSPNATSTIYTREIFTEVDCARKGIHSDPELQPAGALGGITTLHGAILQSHWETIEDGSTYGYLYGTEGTVHTDFISGGGSGDLLSAIGLWGRVRHRSDGNITTAIGVKGDVYSDGDLTNNGDITRASSFLASADATKTVGVLTTRVGYDIEDIATAAHTTDQYGIYCPALVGATGDNLFIKNISANSDFGSGDIDTTGAITGTSVVGDNIYVPDGGFVGVSGADGWLFDSTNGDVTTTSNVGIGTTGPDYKLEVNGTGFFGDKLSFTQTDGNEYIDSLNDGYMDYGATTGHRFGGPSVVVSGDLTSNGTIVADDSLIIGAGTKHDGYTILPSAEVQTTDATVTVVDNITLSDENTYHVEALIVGVKTDGSQRASYHIAGTFYRTSAGNATQQGSTTLLHSEESDANWATTFTVDTNDVRVSVTGVAATTIEWGCTLKYINMSN